MATIREIEARADRLSTLLGFTVHIGTWSPGDGWTRYSLMTSDNQPAFRSERSYRKQELYEALGLAINVAYTIAETNKQPTAICDDCQSEPATDSGYCDRCAARNE